MLKKCYFLVMDILKVIFVFWDVFVLRSFRNEVIVEWKVFVYLSYKIFLRKVKFSSKN